MVVTKTDRMTRMREAVAAHIAGGNRHPLVATIHRNEHGLWWVRCEGGGCYPRELYLESPGLLLALRDDGYAIDDPLHYIDTYGPAEMQEPECSVSAMDADSAGYGYTGVARERRDYGDTGGYDG